MELKDYIQRLQKLAKKYPHATVVAAADEEGNSFHECNFTPSPGNFSNGDFINDDGTLEFEENYGEINAVCLN